MYKLLLWLTAFYLVEGCLITNCPKGGKRSSPASVNHRTRDSSLIKEGLCRRCGPSHEGRCLSPSICCGPKIGCLVGTPAILAQCSDQPPHLPHAARPCSIGACLSDGVCCSTEGCKIDFTCEMETLTDVCNLSEQSVY